jgi:SWI/SNF-related matrix-associated actin-dependent regulator 1 of chromatin subfamily A
MQLFTYQVEGAKFLAEKGRALLADDMGLGKSAQAIRACDEVGPAEVLVICPASVVENWKREIMRFRTTMWGWSVVSYDRAARDGWRPDFDVLILDEAHYLKNHKAKRTKAIFGPKCDGVGGLVEKARHVFCLTGTPTPNNPSELWPMLRAVMPETICGPGGATGATSADAIEQPRKQTPLSYWRFVQRYCRTRDNGFGIQIVGGKNLDELKQRIAPFVLRRKKEDVLKDLPPIRFDELPLDAGSMRACMNLSSAELARVEEALKDGVEGLRKIAPHVAQLRHVTGTAKAFAAAAWMVEQFENGLEKLVVFAHHHDVIKILAAELEQKKIGRAVVTGETPSVLRAGYVDYFQREPSCRAFIGQIQAAGTGITLTAASDVLFVESSWVPAENEQAAMRIHRIGQKNACIVRFATLAGSIDEQIQRAVLRKTADIAKLFN